MVTQQVIGPPPRAAFFLVLTVRDGSEARVREVLQEVSGLVRSVAQRAPEDDLRCVVGIGALLWDRLFDLRRPAHLHPFEPIIGQRHTAPATPGDLLIHLRAGHTDLCFEAARVITGRLADFTDIVDEVHGFRYFDERNVLGFVDGTENPEGSEATDAVLIGSQDPDYAGGSYVVVQKYTHDLSAWDRTSVHDQELAMGRTKSDDLELDDAAKPTNAHIALNVITDADGNERAIVRENMPFGNLQAGEFGTYFIGYAADPTITEQMLRNMFIGDPPGNHDRILDFSTAQTGSLYFVPSLEFLDGEHPPAIESSPRVARATPGHSPRQSHDGSLGIGSLNPRARRADDNHA